MVDQYVRKHLRLLEPIPSHYPTGGRLVGPIQAVLFDIYGTLFISACGDIGEDETNFSTTPFLDTLLGDFHIRASPADLTRSLQQTIQGEHRRKQAEGIEWPEVDIVSVWQTILDWPDTDRVRAFALAYEWTVNPCYPMPGLDQVLRLLRGRELTLGLVSNAQFYTPLLFEWFLGAPPEALQFDQDLTVYSYRYGEAKPSKTLFNRCSAKLGERGIAPTAVVYVGNDMRNDILPASEMAWQTVLFAGDRRSLRLRRDHRDCRDLHPDLVIADLRELLSWI